jgi:outer membrane biogenesis lipoprotein LolB
MNDVPWEEILMRCGLFLLASTVFLLSGCALHSKAWDDAFADCQAQANEQWQTAGLPWTQRSNWQNNFINSCMEKKGVQP